LIVMHGFGIQSEKTGDRYLVPSFLSWLRLGMNPWAGLGCVGIHKMGEHEARWKNAIVARNNAQKGDDIAVVTEVLELRK